MWAMTALSNNSNSSIKSNNTSIINNGFKNTTNNYYVRDKKSINIFNKTKMPNLKLKQTNILYK